jgi:SAM-dependent methyltransferase
MKVLIIGETKITKNKIWKYYSKILKIKDNAEVLCSDIKDSDFNYNWNKIIKLYPDENTDGICYEILDKEIIEHYKIIDNKTIPIFDVIIANNVIEHIYNLGNFFDNVKYHLKKDGLFVIRTDNALYFPYYFPFTNSFLARVFGIGYHSNSEIVQELWNESHYHIFTKSHLISLLNRFGFKVLSVKYGIWKFGIKSFNFFLAPRILIVAQKV